MRLPSLPTFTFALALGACGGSNDAPCGLDCRATAYDFRLPAAPTSIVASGGVCALRCAPDADAGPSQDCELSFSGGGTCTVTLTVGARTSTTVIHVTQPTERCSCGPHGDGTSIDLSPYADAGA